ncbi:MAG: D-alanine--D-alanine ligase family protein [Actinomycetes bacterium]
MDPTPRSRPRVAVVFGGRSTEHAISCVTAAGVLRAIDRDAWDVVPIGVTTTGRWVLAADDPARWEITDGRLPEVPAASHDVVVPLSTQARDLVVLEQGEVPRVLGEVDVVLPLLHGPYGEDGTLQGMLELGDVRYVGSGVLSSALSMDKHFMKLVLAGSGLPVGPYTVILPGQWDSDREGCRAAVDALGYPVFVKPARGGSSIGISRVRDAGGLDAAVEEARRHDPKVVVEAAVVGREIECSVLQSLDGGAPDTSLPGEIAVTGDAYEFYDFDAKYLAADGDVQLTCPADLPAEVTAAVRDLAARTFVAMGCEGLARVDLFYTPDGGLLVNELNTMPGFTPVSMFPRMWQRSGLEYPDLVDRLLRLALRRPTGLR